MSLKRISVPFGASRVLGDDIDNADYSLSNGTKLLRRASSLRSYRIMRESVSAKVYL